MRYIPFAIIILVSLIALGSGFGRAPQSGVVVKAVENMYSKPDDASAVVSQALLGVTVKILASEKNAQAEDWYQIETPDTYQGWISASALRIYRDTEPAYASCGKVIEITSLLALVYEAPDVSEKKPLVKAPISVCLEAGDPGERWCPVTLPCGAKAFIQVGDGVLRQAGFKLPRLSPDETAALAQRFLGLPYQWGGNSPLGFDCSGFVQLIYRLSGIEILRDADLQFAKSGLVEVPRGEENAADLVFFGKASDKISHVGMMISRDQFIHATTYERPVVQVSSLADAHWQALYQGACRLKKDS